MCSWTKKKSRYCALIKTNIRPKRNGFFDICQPDFISALKLEKITNKRLKWILFENE